MKQSIINLTVDSDTQTRKGAFADFAVVSEKDGVARLDFLLGDINPDDSDAEGDIRGVLVSRVFMSASDLSGLRDQLGALLNGETHDGAAHNEA